MKPRVVVFPLWVASLLSGCYTLHPGLTTTTVPEVERKVDGALQVGSTRQEIEAWLGSQGIEFSFSDLPYLESATPIGPRDVHKSGVILGIIRNTSRNVFVTGNISLVFYLGVDDRLERTKITWVGTGL